jgi:hypothetical protein
MIQAMLASGTHSAISQSTANLRWPALRAASAKP